MMSLNIIHLDWNVFGIYLGAIVPPPLVGLYLFGASVIEYSSSTEGYTVGAKCFICKEAFYVS